MGLFSKKPGGTVIGNLIRKVANNATNGLLGTGANMWQAGETKEQYEARVKGTTAQAIGAGTIAAIQTVQNPLPNQGSFSNNVVAGASMQWVKNIAMVLLPLGLVIGVVAWAWKKFGSNKPKKSTW